MFLSVIGRLFLWYVFRTRESNGSKEIAWEAHSRSAKGSEFHSGGFLKLTPFFLKIFITLTLSVRAGKI